MGHDELLKSSEFFAETSKEVLATIAARGESRNLQRGDILFKEGEKPESMYIVLSGRVAIAIGNRPLDSRESMLALMERGDLFGELGLLDGGARSAMARAIEPSSVLQIPYAIVLEQLESNPSMLWGVTKLLAKNTPFTKLNLNNSLAKGDFSALSLVAKSSLPLIKSLFTINFMVAGFGVCSVYTLIVMSLKLCYKNN